MNTFSGGEKKLLKDFSKLLETHFYKPPQLLCAHNGKEFDLPYISYRLLILNLPLPEKLVLFGIKPWEVPHLDTLELLKFGDYKHYNSLKLLTHILGIESPKGDIDGSQVRDVFYINLGIGRIISYCEKDVIAIAQVILKLRQEELLKDLEIIFV